MHWSPAILYALVAAVANIVGGLFISTKPALNPKILKYLIASGAGFMLAAVFLNIIPASLEISKNNTNVFTLVLAGYLVIQFCEHTIVSHFHFGEETHSHLLSTSSAFTAVGGLAIHTFFDGISIAAGFAVDVKLGVLIFIAMIMHKLPEGFTVASIMIAAGQSRKTAFLSSVFIGLVTLIGTLFILLFKKAAIYALPLSAGVTLYVAASDLIPEVNNGAERTVIPLVVFGGVVFYYITEVFIDFLMVS
jgi:zinc transporter ZupT